MEEDARKIEGLAESVRRRLPDDETMAEVAELFKMFGDPTRAKILGCLQIRELNVGEIADVLNMSVSAVSHQLRVLRAAKLVNENGIPCCVMSGATPETLYRLFDGEQIGTVFGGIR